MGQRAVQQLRVAKPMLQSQLEKGGLRAHVGQSYFAGGGGAGALAAAAAFTAWALICAAAALTCGCTFGPAAALSHHSMASSYFPPLCSAKARRTMYAGSGADAESTALLNPAAAASYFLRVRFAWPMTL